MTTIAVIGAGPAGLSICKELLATSQTKCGDWEKPVVFESRAGVGGIWVPDAEPHQHPQTPLYNSLTTNLPHPVMSFQCFPFPPSTPVFPSAKHVQSYLEEFASHFDLMACIRFGEKVISLHWDSTQWILTSSKACYRFDRVVVANGHHSVPRIPDIPGVQAWLDANVASHSIWYRKPSHLGDKVLVIGGGPSGNDISAELSSCCITLIRSYTGAPNEEHGNVKTRGRTVKLGEAGRVEFADGTVETDVDYCILATGYKVDIPFLQLATGIPPACPPLPSVLYNSSYHLFPLARHLFPIQTEFPPSTLAFMGLPVRVAPLPVMEAQAAAIIKVFAEPSSLDIDAESQMILKRYQTLDTACNGDHTAVARLWSIFDEDQQFKYQDELFRFAGSSNTVPQWRKDMYSAKALLRAFWVELERRGEAEEWVRDVEGMDAWVAVMQRLLKKAREWNPQVKLP
ncbi:hypothetical protein MIND_00161300 [Mycena indigotica]|uniref:FAD/NAD(P)-binding domain-containing protein n=1 Tax=Mycena indigotica TaxID=2126181 RepID=A0A8H6WF59_9AGAR|nr:uncharacterized protein MIND_00161300 [Mycena indigotica]KAF7316424.1 hypothetical protein MIND_00161300 [Mycena indigotica]